MAIDRPNITVIEGDLLDQDVEVNRMAKNTTIRANEVLL